MLQLIIFFSLALSGFALTTEELAMFKPRLENYTDPNTGLNAEIYAVDNGDGSQTIHTNGIPSHETWIFPDESSQNPNSIAESVVDMKIYSEPIMRESPLRCVPMDYIGITTAGTVIYNMYPAEETCPNVSDFEELGICEGHPSPDGTYHHHYYSPCIQMPECGEPSPLYGVALDGIPIFGPFDEDGRQLTSQDLDECGGKYDSTGRYKYHIVIDPPYLLSCFMGEIRSDGGKEDSEYKCVCPHDDTEYRNKGAGGPPVFSESVCSSSEDGDEPITCWADEYLSELDVELGFEYRKVKKEVDLVPCCLKGNDCGVSCKTDDGIKEECYVETRTIDYLSWFAVESGTDDGSGDDDSGDDLGPGPMPGPMPGPRPGPRPGPW